jgi:hypothetical protein
LTGRTVGQYKVVEACKVLWARGHLHAGGDKMIFEVNGKNICESKPTYNSQNVITAMSLCPDIINLKSGDSVNIISVYDTNKHQL